MTLGNLPKPAASHRPRFFSRFIAIYGLRPARRKFTLAKAEGERMGSVERRSNEADRRGADARGERNYAAARRRIVALEKALDMIVGALAPGDHLLDQRKIAQFRQGIDV